VTENGFAINRAQIALHAPIKNIGLHKVPVLLHPEVEVSINLAVGRNADEAQRIARGEDILVRPEEDKGELGEDIAALPEAFFEPEAAEARRTRESAGETAEQEAATAPKPNA
jgi:large subunit ribosomal protein L9